MAPYHGLVHGTQYDDISDSNVAWIGTAIDHRVKYASAATEPAWHDGIVGQQPGLCVWRIEDFAVVPVPAASVGTFYDGDSYIVLHSYRVGREALGHDIFFWLGAHTSQDEAGTAAYKTIELDEFLGGAATQHRELQGGPSDAFRALFPAARIQSGGVATGFRHVDADAAAQARLDRRKAAQTLLRVHRHDGASGDVVVTEVAPAAASLDEGDVYVLDSGANATVYVWQGRRASPLEKARAAAVAQDLQTPAHTGGVQVLAQDEGRAQVVVRLLEAAAAAGAADEETTTTAERSVAAGPSRLFRLSDADGSLSFSLIKETTDGADLADLDTNDVLLWDAAGREVWVWEGLGASANERAHWLRVAQAYVQRLAATAGPDAGLTPIAKVRQGCESAAFLQSLRGVSV